MNRIKIIILGIVYFSMLLSSTQFIFFRESLYLSTPFSRGSMHTKYATRFPDTWHEFYELFFGLEHLPGTLFILFLILFLIWRKGFQF